MPRLLNQVTVAVATQVVLLGGLLHEKMQAATFRLEEATIASINDAFDSGLTSEALSQLYLNRIDAYDEQGPQINSIITLNPNALKTAAELDQERQQTGPRGPLHGVPILLKDNIDTSDLPTTAGSLALKGSIPPDDAFITKQLRDAGAVILGKANLTEFANFLAEDMPSGYSSLGGYVYNPYNPNPEPDGDGTPILSPGGSSAGSAAAIAANFAAVSIGTETSGSILSPAYRNSVVGIKPTVGLVSRDGIIPIASSQDTAGPFGRTVADAATLLGGITGIDPSDPATSTSEGKSYDDYRQFLDSNRLDGARIGVPQDVYWEELEDGEVAIVEDAIDAIEGQGATIVYEEIPTAAELAEFESSVLYYEFQRDLNTYLTSLGQDAPVKTLAEVIAFNNANPETALKYGQARALEAQALDLEADLQQYLADRATDLRLAKDEGIDFFLDEYDLDAILFPASRGAGIGAKAGYPSISVPGGYLEDGAPYGITFLGEAYSEPDLIGFAYDYEQATLNRRPSTFVPALPGEPVPEPGTTAALALAGVGALSFKLKQQHKLKKSRRSVLQGK